MYYIYYIIVWWKNNTLVTLCCAQEVTGDAQKIQNKFWIFTRILVTLVETMWNPLVADIYRIKGATTVLYTNSVHITR